MTCQKAACQLVSTLNGVAAVNAASRNCGGTVRVTLATKGRFGRGAAVCRRSAGRPCRTAGPAKVFCLSFCFIACGSAA